VSLVHAVDREDIFKEIDILVGMNHENVIFFLHPIIAIIIS